MVLGKILVSEGCEAMPHVGNKLSSVVGGRGKLSVLSCGVRLVRACQCTRGLGQVLLIVCRSRIPQRRDERVCLH
eukprot:3318953-Amphidinium_carterae.1